MEKMAKAEKLTPMQVGEAEDEIGDWLDDHGIADGWDLAPALVAVRGQHRLAGRGRRDRARRAAAGRHPLGRVRAGDRAADGRDRGLDHRISTLVGAAKQYSQMDRAAHADIDVHDGLKSTLVMLRPQDQGVGHDHAGQGLRPTSLPLIPAHPAELNQVWTNLIDNAIQAMPDGGTLTIRTALDGDCVLVEIGDTGAGIPKDLQQKIFEPFFTTKPVGEGTGLGLDISYRVITQRHGGDLRVVSEPGDTRFQVRLPVHRAALHWLNAGAGRRRSRRVRWSLWSAPSGPVDPARLEAGAAIIASWGLTVAVRGTTCSADLGRTARLSRRRRSAPRRGLRRGLDRPGHRGRLGGPRRLRRPADGRPDRLRPAPGGRAEAPRRILRHHGAAQPARPRARPGHGARAGGRVGGAAVGPRRPVGACGS